MLPRSTSSSSFVHTLPPLVMLLAAATLVVRGEPYTLTGAGYVEYGQWLASVDGLASFSFTTSQENALLFYVDSSGDGGNYLAVWLEGGKMKVRMNVDGDPHSPQVAEFGQHLNNLTSRTLSILHVSGTFDFTIGADSARLHYRIGLHFPTRSHVFIGGIPASYEPDYAAVATLNRFAGCMDEVKFANNSVSPVNMRPGRALIKEGFRAGCADACADDATRCNGGLCVRSWTRSEGYFCDCSSTDRAGQHCNEDLSTYQLSLSGDSYKCYALAHEPFTPDHDDLTVQLQSPLPVTGTLVTGRSQNGTDSFALYLDASRLHYVLRVEENVVLVNESNTELRPDATYRISLTRTESLVVITIQTVSSTNQIADVETMELVLPTDTSEPVFSSVCLGGGVMETPLYEGVMEKVVIGHIALLETEDSVSIARGNVIHVRNSSSSSLDFVKHGLHSADEIRFQFRSDMALPTGMLIKVSSFLHLSIFTFGGETKIVAFVGIDRVCIAERMNVTATRWHRFELRKTAVTGSNGNNGNERDLVFYIDDNSVCRIRGSELDLAAIEREQPTFELGARSSGYTQPGVHHRSLSGCFRDVQFKSGTEIFRPNLEVPIMTSEGFSDDGCRGCEQGQINNLCREDRGTCFYKGYNNVTCQCLEPFSGPSCNDLSVTPGSSSTPTPPTTPDTTDSQETTSSSSSSPGVGVGTSSSERSGAEEKDDGVDYHTLGQWIGIVLAIILVLVLLSAVLVFIACFVHSQRIKRIGFYQTHENTPSVSLPHFSASLKTAHSHTLNLEQNRVTAITNGRTVHPTYASGEKEFYI